MSLHCDSTRTGGHHFDLSRRQALCAAFGAGLPLLLPAAAGGQQKSDTRTEQAEKLTQDLADIEWLKYITPLHLTSGQITSVIQALTDARATYTHKVNSLAADRFLKMADEIKQVKEAALQGTMPSSDFETRVQQESTDFDNARKQLNLENIASVAKALRPILSPDQVLTAVHLAEDDPVISKSYGHGTHEQEFNLYVAEILIGYPNIIPLLKEVAAVSK